MNFIKKVKLTMVALMVGLSSITLVSAQDNTLVNPDENIQEDVVHEISELEEEKDVTNKKLEQIPEEKDNLIDSSDDQVQENKDKNLEPEVKSSKKIHAILTNNGDVLPVGTVAQFQLYLHFEGQMEVYKDVSIKIQLPKNIDGKTIVFNQDLSELKIMGELPTYDETLKTLEYNIEEVSGGFETSIPIKIVTSNGANLNEEVLTLGIETSTSDVEVVKATSSTTLSAAGNMSLTNQLIGIDVDGETINKSSVRYEDHAVFGVGVSANKFANGTMALKDKTFVVLKYTLADGFTYVSNNSGLEPTIDGQTLTWIFDPSDYKDETYYYAKHFEIIAKLTEELELFSRTQNVLSGEMTFIDDEVINESATTTFLISPDYSKDPAISFPSDAFATMFSGPNDAFGNSSGSANKDIEVTDGALLGWNIFMTPLNGTSPVHNANTYDMFFYPDSNSSILRFYSGDFYFRPSTAYNNAGVLPLEKPVHYSISAKYNDNDDWDRLVEFVEPGRMYTSEELNIDPERELEYLWLHFHNGEINTYATYLGYQSHGGEWLSLQPGVTSSNMRFYTTINEGYVGKIENKFGVSYSAWTSGEYLTQGDSYNIPEVFTSHNHGLLPDSYLAFMTNKTVRVVEPPEGPARYVKANAYFEKSDKNLLSEGNNKLNVVIGNDDASLKKLNGPFISYAVLDEGISITDLDSVTGGTVEIIDTNYKDSSKTLIKINFDVREITINRNSAVQIPVKLSSDMSYKTDIKFIGYLDEDFEVSTSTNTNGTLTEKEVDVDDFNGNGDTTEEIFSVTNTYTYRDSYEFAGMLYDKNDASFIKADKNDVISTKLKILNNLDTSIKELSMVFVLPKVSDTYVLSNDARDSEFNVNLHKEVVLPKQYKDRFEVLYSTALEPEIKGELDAHVGDLRVKLIDDLTEETTVWLSGSEVNDFSTINSIKITMKDGSKPIRESELNFEIDLIVEDFETDAKFAYGSYAFAVNDASVLETQDLIIEYEEKEIIDDEYSIEASNITLTEFEAKTMQEEGTLNKYLLDHADVKLFKNGVSIDDLSDVTVAIDGEVEDIIAGEYTMIFKWSDNSSTPVILLAQTKANLTVVADDNEYIIEASDITLTVDEANRMQDQGTLNKYLLDHADVKLFKNGVSIKDLSDVTVTIEGDVEDIIAGEYTMIFKWSDNSSETVTLLAKTESILTVVNDDVTGPGPEKPKPEKPNPEKPTPEKPAPEKPNPVVPTKKIPTTGIKNPIVKTSILGIVGIVLLKSLKSKKKN